MNKTYKTYQARNAVKAALVTNHIKAAKKNGVSHVEAKAEAYRLYNIKAGLPFLKAGLYKKQVEAKNAAIVALQSTKPSLPVKLPPLPKPQLAKLPPLPVLPKVVN